MTVIDRFENGYAVLVNEKGSVSVPESELPPEAAEGDVVLLRGGRYVTDRKATEKKRKQVRERLQRLIKEDKR
ncbi:MAG: DUF3006 domain-containing protein [Ruminococcus sp.]|uniref:DUF3006 domain-containing protein n=1 Tax=Ruminococcus sp. TaxID=41978 RepID=UPI0025F16FFB|nr:DUF3006 domain-containing protein [Ruminococcus sp.]MBR5681853.1 DUF3006 domain-containing protein [Ruminococcus sp.]